MELFRIFFNSFGLDLCTSWVGNNIVGQLVFATNRWFIIPEL